MTAYPEGKKPLAMIIEDDYDARLIFATALEAAGYEIEIIQDGNAALTRLNEVVPVVVVLDLHLPYASGEEILQHIRADERLADTRVILATADALIAERLRADADLALLKPIDFSQLRDLSARLHPPDIIG